jgi:hypothetical protein
VLKSVAKTALPMAGGALDNLVLPGVGGATGGKLASAAGSMFGLELEGLSQDDREFEVAKQYVRLAGDATKIALSAPPGQPDRGRPERGRAGGAELRPRSWSEEPAASTPAAA